MLSMLAPIKNYLQIKVYKMLENFLLCYQEMRLSKKGRFIVFSSFRWALCKPLRWVWARF